MIKHGRARRSVSFLNSAGDLLREYFVSVSDLHAAPPSEQVVTLTCADDDCDRAGGGAFLPPYADGGQLNELVYESLPGRGDATIVLRKGSLQDVDSWTIYKGGVRGTLSIPFARHGPGRVSNAPCSWNSSVAGRSLLTGNWDKDGWMRAQSQGRPSGMQFFGQGAVHTWKSSPTECQACLHVYVFNPGRVHECSIAASRPLSTARAPARTTGASVVRGTTAPGGSRAPHTPSPFGGQGARMASGGSPAQQTPSPSGGQGARMARTQAAGGVIDFIAGRMEDVVFGFVINSLHPDTLLPKGGCGGAMAFVRLHLTDTDSSFCSAKQCAALNLCRTGGKGCAHMQRLRAFHASQAASPEARVSPESHMSLDGFMGLMLADPCSMPPRCCSQAFCRMRAAAAPSAAGEVEEGVDEGAAIDGACDGTDGEDVRGGEQSEDDTFSTAPTNATEGLDEIDGLAYASEHAYGYRPARKDIEDMKVIRLRTLAATYNLDPQFKKARLVVDLVRLFHGEGGVEELDAKLREKARCTQDQKLAGKKRKRSGGAQRETKAKLGGMIARAPEPGIAERVQAFNDAVRSRWCAEGSMCDEHMRQQQKGAEFAQRLREALSSEEAPPVDEVDGNDPAPSAANADVDAAAGADSPVDEEARLRKLPLGTRMLFTPLDVDKILHSILISRLRHAEPVIRISPKLFIVHRHDEGDGQRAYKTPGGYSLVTVKVTRPGSGSAAAAVLVLHCTCTEFRNCASRMGGKSKLAAARTCTCCKMVVAANVLASDVGDVVAGASAWQLTVQATLQGVQNLDPALHRAHSAPPIEGESDNDDDDTPVTAHDPKVMERADLLQALVDAKPLPEEWPLGFHNSMIVAENQLESRILTSTSPELQCELQSEAEHTSDTVSVPREVFPETLSALPVHAPVCPRGCTTACQEPLPLKIACHSQRPSGATARTAWVFIGRVVRLQVLKVYSCDGCRRKGQRYHFHPFGTEWTRRTGLFNVADAWFFSVLLLDKVSKKLRYEHVPPWRGCASVLQETWAWMVVAANDKYKPHLPPSFEQARRRMFDAWKAYELACKECNGKAWSVCPLCGIGVAKGGSDGCIKVNVALGREDAQKLVEYETTGGELWTQERVFTWCRTHLLQGTLWGNRTQTPPLPVLRMPPMFHNMDYASEVTLPCVHHSKRAQPTPSAHCPLRGAPRRKSGATKAHPPDPQVLHNSEVKKVVRNPAAALDDSQFLPRPDEGGTTESAQGAHGTSADSSSTAEKDISVTVTDSNAGKRKLTLSTKTMEPLADLVFNGLDIAREIRSASGTAGASNLDDILVKCGVNDETLRLLNSSEANKKAFLLAIEEAYHAGESECHLFVQAHLSPLRT